MKKLSILLIVAALLTLSLTACGFTPEESDSGTYLIGTDLDAGTYILVPDANGYFAIKSDSSGSLSSIISNENFSGRCIVTLNNGEYFELTRAKMYTRANAPAITPDSNGYYAEGMYEVGVDINEGEYKIEAIGSSAYLAVSNSARHTLSAIISNDNFTTNKYQTVSDGQFITIKGAKMKLASPSDGENNNDNVIAAGNYLIGTDLDAGEYVMIPSGNGYFAITSDSSGSLSSIISNENFSGRCIVKLNDGEYFELTRANMYTRMNAPAITPDSNGYYAEGMYEVGVDIDEGEYKIEATGSSAYVEVSSSARHTLSAIISNDNFTTNKYQTVSNGQFIMIKGAKMKLVTA